LVVNGETSARKIISSNIKDLHIIAKGLLEYETLTSSDIDLLLKGKKPKRPKEEDVKENLKENDDNKKKKSKNIEKPIGSVPVTAKNIS
jgi:cell division protease FtsH